MLAAVGAAAFAALAAAMGEPKGRLDTTTARVSIIVPVLNESRCLAETLAMLAALSPTPHEIILVDGGSTDGTAALAARLGARVLRSGRGRAVQMNAGARAATGDILCFLHADTKVPSDLVAVLRREFVDPKTVLTGTPQQLPVFSSSICTLTVLLVVKHLSNDDKAT